MRSARRRGGLHAVACDGDLLVWDADAVRLHRLTGLAASVFLVVGHEPSDAAAVTRALEGPPDRVPEVEAVLGSLVAASLLASA